MRAVQHDERRVELQLDSCVVLPERQDANQSLRYPA